MALAAKDPNRHFSVVIPTYTGTDSIQSCIESIAEQAVPDKSWEIVVVVDGPNKDLINKVNKLVEALSTKDRPIYVHQHEKNRGRFEARRSGALAAHSKQLFFVDDRVTLLEPSLLRGIVAAGEPITMPNVIEKAQPNLLSRTMFLIRRRVYGKEKWGEDFKPYYISRENFERSPKGTTSLWIPKDIFLEACEAVLVEETGKDTKHISDDTKLLRRIVSSGQKIYRPSALKVYYTPRQGFLQEAHHLFQRGPKFVDYYFKRGSRFQPYLTASLIGVLVFVVGASIGGWWFVLGVLGACLIGLLLMTIMLMEKLHDLGTLFIILPLMAVIFGGGVIKGVVAKTYRKLIRLYN